MNKRVKKLILPAIIFIVSGILYTILWHTTGHGLPCIFYKVTGLYCPGCGTGRMMMSLISLNIYQAFRYNPAVFIALPFISYHLFISLYDYVKGQTKMPGKIQRVIFIILLVFILGVGILRNMSVFNFLAPI